MGALLRLLSSMGLKAGPKTQKVIATASKNGGAKALVATASKAGATARNYSSLAVQRLGKLSPGALSVLRNQGPRAAAVHILDQIKANPVGSVILLAEAFMIGDYFIDAWMEEIDSLPAAQKLIAKATTQEALNSIEEVIASKYESTIINGDFIEINEPEEVFMKDADGVIPGVPVTVAKAEDIPNGIYTEVSGKIKRVLDGVFMGRPRLMKEFIELQQLDADLFKLVFEKEHLNKG